MTRAPIAGPARRASDGSTAPSRTTSARVLRLRAGDTFVAFDPATRHARPTRDDRVGDDGVVVHVGALREAHDAARRATLTWIQGLAKGDKCDAVVRDATELGATRIVVASTQRSVVKLDAARVRRAQARWARIASEAARQCGRGDAPRVDAPRPWADALAARRRRTHARFCLWERATEPLAPPLFEALARGRGARVRVRARGRPRRRGGREAPARGWRSCRSARTSADRDRRRRRARRRRVWGGAHE